MPEIVLHAQVERRAVSPVSRLNSGAEVDGDLARRCRQSRLRPSLDRHGLVVLECDRQRLSFVRVTQGPPAVIARPHGHAQPIAKLGLQLAHPLLRLMGVNRPPHLGWPCL